MKIPFIPDNTKDPEKKKLHKVIQREAFDIVKKFAIGKLTTKEIDKLDKLYATYYKKYPDIEGEARANKRIAQLRGLIK